MNDAHIFTSDQLTGQRCDVLILAGGVARILRSQLQRRASVFEGVVAVIVTVRFCLCHPMCLGIVLNANL